MLRIAPWTLLFSVIIFSSLGCLKSSSDSCSPKTPASESNSMLSFATANALTVTTHSSGLMYQIVDTGTGATPNLNSKVYITYTGTLLNGSVFDQQSNSALTGWPLNQLIEGWRVGLPLIKVGGEIKLIVPSSMAYGCTGYGGIPANAVLYFDIHLVNVVN